MATDYRKAKTSPKQDPEDEEGEPTWEIARLFPRQGTWTQEEYFDLPDNHFVELSDGYLEFLPMPTIYHQLILKFLCLELDAFVKAGKLGIVVTSGYKVRVRRGKLREPDILFIKAEHMSGIGKQYCKKVDLVMEIVSERNRAHDIVKKREEYARAAIPDYWIVDPEKETITVLVLKRGGESYVDHGVFTKGARATSKVLTGFSVDVTAVVMQKPEMPA